MSHAEPSAASWPDPAGGNHRTLANFRDLGGLPLTGGGVTRPGVLYRSDAMYPGDVAPTQAPLWPPAVVVDLCSPGESGTGGYCWPAGVRGGSDPAAAAGGGRRSLPGVVIAGPVLVHCAAGKDRTGVAVAVLLMAAGVEPASVVADYTATAPRIPVLLSRLEVLGRRLPAAADEHPELLGTPAEAITAVTERLASWPGGLPGWLAAHGASPDDAARWRDRLAGPDPGSSMS